MFAVLRGVSRRGFSNSSQVFAGHSKWQNIKHKKARNDKERAAQYTRIAHQITVAAKEGGGPDPAKNIRLATMIETASKFNLPKRVIEGAIERANPSSGSGGQSITYEGIGPGGVAYIVEAVTDNKNRTAQNVRAAFTHWGAGLAPSAYLFERKGYIILADKHTKDFDSVFENVAEFDSVDDIVVRETNIVVYTPPSELSAAAHKIKELYDIEDMGLGYEPIEDQAIRTLDEETQARVNKLSAMLEDVDDVHSVYTNQIT